MIFPKPPHTLIERVCCGTSSLCSAWHRWNVPKFITLYHLVRSGMLCIRSTWNGGTFRGTKKPNRSTFLNI